MTPTNRNSLISHTPTETKFIFPTMSEEEEVPKRAVLDYMPERFHVPVQF